MRVLEKLVAAKTPGDENGSNDRIGWNALYSTLAMRLKTDATTLARDHSLVKILYMLKLNRQDRAAEELEEAAGG